MTTADMQAKFHALTAEANRLRDQLKPLQTQVDDLNTHIEAKKAELRQITTVLLTDRKPLVEIENQRAALSRALGGKTGAV